MTLQSGGMLIEVNLERTRLSGEAEVSLLGPAGELLPELLDVEPRVLMGAPGKSMHLRGPARLRRFSCGGAPLL